MAGRDAHADRAERDPVLVDLARARAASARESDSRKRARTIPSFRLIDSPSGSTTQSRAVKSVSTAVEAACSVTVTSPISSRSRSSGAVV